MMMMKTPLARLDNDSDKEEKEVVVFK